MEIKTYIRYANKFIAKYHPHQEHSLRNDGLLVEFGAFVVANSCFVRMYSMHIHFDILTYKTIVQT